jgi:hypothetical protein
MPNDKSPPEQETITQQENGGDCVSRLVGRLVFAGDLEINSEKISGCALDIDRATLMRAAELPMYRPCAILAIDEKGMNDFISECVPGGDSCDPQVIADSIREYFLANV